MVDLSENTHYLYVETKTAHKWQVIKSFTETLIKAGLATRFKVAFVNRGVEYMGYCYVWIEDEKVFNRFIGSADGIADTDTIPDPNWKPPTYTVEERMEQIDIKFPADSKNWGTQSDREEAIEKLNNSFVPRLIEIAKAPELQLEMFEYTDDQIAHNIEIVSETSESELPKYGDFIVGPAFVPRNNSMIQQHVICCKNTPDWIKENEIKKLFEPFTSDSTTIHERVVNKSKIRGTYPFVTIFKPESCDGPTNRICYVTFDQNTIDGRMALLVNRKLNIARPPKNGENCKIKIDTLIFNHPRANISQTNQ